MTITVCLPTIGRPTLARALKSCDGADEVLVDYNQDGDNGYAARNRMIARATGSHLAFCDDDDQFTAGAIGLFRDAAERNPGKVTIFKMKYHHGHELWQNQVVAYGNFGTPCLLVPNIPEKLGRWAPHTGSSTGGDFTFGAECVANLGPPIWREEVVCLVRPA